MTLLVDPVTSRINDYTKLKTNQQKIIENFTGTIKTIKLSMKI